MATITTRAGKGSALTHAEVDANFTNLNTDKLEASQISGDITINGSNVASISGGVIVNADISNSAAIAGTKISPDFGGQLVQTDNNGRFGGASVYTTITGTSIEVGQNNNNGAVLVDLIDASVSGGSDYAARLIREAGPTGLCTLATRGGQLNFATESSNPIRLSTNGQERVRVGAGGALSFNATENLNTTPGLGDTDNGVAYEFPGGGFFFSRNSGTSLFASRNGTTGNIVDFNYNGNFHGGVSINGDGTTISYNTFTGSHWGRLVDNTTPEILLGTVMETVDQPITWRYTEFEDVDSEGNPVIKKRPYTGPSGVGQTVSFSTSKGQRNGVVKDEDEGFDVNKHLCVKVSDTPQSKAVFGVFLEWTNDENSVVEGSWPDCNIAAIGNYVIRMDAGETPAIGDYVESAGNGCARVQADDILHSYTIAKITSTTPQRTYPDGSFLVTCTLHCG